MKTSQKYLVVVAAVCGLWLAAPRSRAAILTSYYTFDGNTLNSVGGAPNGTLQGTTPPTFMSGAPGGLSPSGALNFTGAGYVDTTTSGLPVGPDLFSGSVALWLKTTASVSESLMGDLALGAGWTRFELDLNTPSLGKMEVLVWDKFNNPFTADLSTANQTWRDGNWHSLAFTWNVTNNTSAIYIDGVSQAMTNSGALGNNGFDAWDQPMVIGARNASDLQPIDQFFTGSLDDVRIYRGELTQSEVNSLPAVPEPFTFLLLGLGGLIAWRRKRMK